MSPNSVFLQFLGYHFMTNANDVNDVKVSRILTTFPITEIETI